MLFWSVLKDNNIIEVVWEVPDTLRQIFINIKNIVNKIDISLKWAFQVLHKRNVISVYLIQMQDTLMKCWFALFWTHLFEVQASTMRIDCDKVWGTHANFDGTPLPPLTNSRAHIDFSPFQVKNYNYPFNIPSTCVDNNYVCT